ncbi:MAG: tripartite tricarboxylate transporter permease [Nitrososphaerales archaeon]
MFEGIIEGLMNVFTPLNFATLLIGIILGMFAGATPGVSGTMMVAVMMPFTYKMPPDTAFILLSAIYATSVFSGSITAILFRVPGAPEASATVFDGYEMTKKGLAHEALGWSIFSSFLGGTIGALVLLTLTPPLAEAALLFESPETFSLVILALCAVSALAVANPIKAIIGAFFGLWLSTIGLDPMTGISRFSFGIPFLNAGIDFISVVLGLFAVSEVFRMVQDPLGMMKITGEVKTVLPKLKAIKKVSPIYSLTIPVGLGIGILPGIGATTAAFVSYALASGKWRDKKFGTGIPEGIAAPESANNAAAMGAMIPLFAFGIPGSATTAILLGGLIFHGLRPGPLLFSQFPVFAYTVIFGAIFANISIILISPIFIRYFVKLLQIPKGILGPLILILCIGGTFAVRNNIIDVWILFIFGIIGYILEEYKWPLAPIVMGLVLGELTERNLRRSLLVSGGNPMIFFTRPISGTILAITIILLLIPLLSKIRGKRIPIIEAKE